MPQVIQRFRERYQDMKLYKVGDAYDYEDAERIAYLVKQGFLSPSESAKEPSGEAGNGQKESDQKEPQADNPINGDGTTQATGDPAQGKPTQEPAAQPTEEKEKKRGGKEKAEAAKAE